MRATEDGEKRFIIYHLIQLVFWLGILAIVLYSRHTGSILYQSIIFFVIVLVAIVISVATSANAKLNVYQ